MESTGEIMREGDPIEFANAGFRDHGPKCTFRFWMASIASPQQRGQVFVLAAVEVRAYAVLVLEKFHSSFDTCAPPRGFGVIEPG